MQHTSQFTKFKQKSLATLNTKLKPILKTADSSQKLTKHYKREEVVSIGAFLYSGVCFPRFIFKCKLNHFQRAHSFSAMFQSADNPFLSLTHCSIVSYTCIYEQNLLTVFYSFICCFKRSSFHIVNLRQCDLLEKL